VVSKANERIYERIKKKEAGFDLLFYFDNVTVSLTYFTDNSESRINFATAILLTLPFMGLP